MGGKRKAGDSIGGQGGGGGDKPPRKPGPTTRGDISKRGRRQAAPPIDQTRVTFLDPNWGRNQAFQREANQWVAARHNRPPRYADAVAATIV